jgi:hypothetical protein
LPIHRDIQLTPLPLCSILFFLLFFGWDAKMKSCTKRLGDAPLVLNESSLKKSHFCPLSLKQLKRIKLVCFGKTHVNASAHFFPQVSGVNYIDNITKWVPPHTRRCLAAWCPSTKRIASMLRVDVSLCINAQYV